MPICFEPSFKVLLRRDKIHRAERMFAKALGEAEAGAEGGGAKHLFGSKAEQKSIRQQIISRADILNAMSTVAHVNGVSYKSKAPGALRNWILESLKHTGFKVERQGFGTIIFDEKE